jgi:NitT/TauT family transport system permease protein
MPASEAGTLRPARRRAGPSGPLLAAISILSIALAWQIAAGLADSRLLPTPGAVLATMAREAVAGGLIHHVGVTLARVAAAFVIAMAIGSALGLAMGRNRLFDRLLDGWLILFLNLPALVVVILAYVWFGLTEAAAIGAVAVNKIPTVVVTVREGARSLDRELLQMAHSFRFGAWKLLRHVIVPQLAPYLVAAARSGLALIWKIVLVVELLGRSDGVGFQLHLYFQLFDVTGILAYTFAFVVVMQAIEWGAMQPLERHASRWRG